MLKKCSICNREFEFQKQSDNSDSNSSDVFVCHVCYDRRKILSTSQETSCQFKDAKKYFKFYLRGKFDSDEGLMNYLLGEQFPKRTEADDTQKAGATPQAGTTSKADATPQAGATPMAGVQESRPFVSGTTSNYYAQQGQKSEDEEPLELDTFMGVICFILPFIGWMMYAANAAQSPKTAKKCMIISIFEPIIIALIVWWAMA